MKKTLIVVFAIAALIGSAGFQTVTGQDTAAYLVMIANQGTQITNQLTALTRMTAHIDQLTGQFEHLKEDPPWDRSAQLQTPSPISLPCPPTCSTPRATGTPISPARPGAS